MIRVWFDGNGNGSIGVIIKGLGKTYRKGELIGSNTMSGNLAEYAALLYALQFLKDKGLCSEKIIVYGDSLLTIRQMTGAWRIRSGIYKEVALLARELSGEFKHVKYVWICREKNKAADKLAENVIKKLRNRGE